MKRISKIIKAFLVVFILMICLCCCTEANGNLSSENRISYSSEISREIQYTSSVSEYKITTVYITPTGKRYHLSSTCGGKNSTPASLDDAIQIYNLTPCKKCAQ